MTPSALFTASTSVFSSSFFSCMRVSSSSLLIPPAGVPLILTPGMTLSVPAQRKGAAPAVRIMTAQTAPAILFILSRLTILPSFHTIFQKKIFETHVSVPHSLFQLVIKNSKKHPFCILLGDFIRIPFQITVCISRALP